MTARFYWMEGQREALAAVAVRRPRTGPRYLRGWLVLALLTALLCAWLAYHHLARPAWLEGLPELFGEALQLIELGGTITLALVLVGLYWRARGRAMPAPTRARTVAELKQLSPEEFELYVGSLFRRKRYTVVHRGGSGDHGVDLELRSPDGRRAIVQCKRYRNTVGEQTVRDLLGTLIHERAAHAFLATSAEISDAAYAWAAGKPITLLDGRMLVQIAAELDERPA